jgi:hypothetical protein
MGLQETSPMGRANYGISQAFENTSTNVAASQMRNALNKLVDTVTDENEKKVSANLITVAGGWF